MKNLMTLPNGLVVSCAGIEDEMRMVYQENFVEKQYFKHGVSLAPGATVLDVGGNMGIFSIFAAQTVGPAGRVVALEPSPATAEAARFNVKSHAKWLAEQGAASGAAAPVDVLQVACGDGSVGKLTLTVYDNLSVLNSVCPNYAQAHCNVKSTIVTQVKRGESKGMGMNAFERFMLAAGRWAMGYGVTRACIDPVCSLYAHYLLSQRRKVEVDMVTVSGVMESRGLETIDLLKVDVERAELAVMQGVKHSDWPRIKQVAMEVHEDVVKEVETILKTAGGFTHVVTEVTDDIIGPGMYMIFATRA